MKLHKEFFWGSGHQLAGTPLFRASVTLVLNRGK